MTTEITPTPAVAAPLKRPPQPNHQEHSANVEGITKQIDTLKAEVDKLKAQISGNGSGSKEVSQQRKDLKQQIDDLKKEQSSHWDHRNRLQDQQKQLQESIKRKINEINSSKEKLGFRSAMDIDRRINDLEAQVNSGSLKLIEEKRVLADISSLRKHKKLFDSFDSQESSVSKDRARADEIRAQLQALEPESKKFKASMDELYAKLRELDSDRNETQSKFKGLIAKKEELQKKINELVVERREKHAEFNKMKEEFDAYMKEERARKAIAYKQQKEERDRQRKMEQIQRQLELAEIPAFEDEINTCNALVHLLQSFTPEGQQAQQQTPLAPTAANGEVRPVSKDESLPKGVKNAVALKKKTDRMDEDMFFVAPKKKAQQQQKPKENKEKDLKFDLVVMEQFFKLKVDLPAKSVDVPKTIEALKEKKKFFLENQAKVTKENIAKAKAMEEKMLKQLAEAKIEDSTADAAEVAPAEEAEQ